MVFAWHAFAFIVYKTRYWGLFSQLQRESTHTDIHTHTLSTAMNHHKLGLLALVSTAGAWGLIWRTVSQCLPVHFLWSVQCIMYIGINSHILTHSCWFFFSITTLVIYYPDYNPLHCCFLPVWWFSYKIKYLAQIAIILFLYGSRLHDDQ